MVMTRVGESPLHSVRSPSFCEILRRPSQVLLIVLRSTSSTAQVASAGFSGATVGPATQSGAELLDQKTSRQHVVIPRLGCKSRNWVSEPAVKVEERRAGEAVGMWSCDCRRTRTTSSGVTGQSALDALAGEVLHIPRSEVMTLPVVAAIIFCTTVTVSAGTASSMARLAMATTSTSSRCEASRWNPRGARRWACACSGPGVAAAGREDGWREGGRDCRA